MCFAEGATFLSHLSETLAFDVQESSKRPFGSLRKMAKRFIGKSGDVKLKTNAIYYQPAPLVGGPVASVDTLAENWSPFVVVMLVIHAMTIHFNSMAGISG